ncbi:MAG TPA: SatD family protein [Methylomusa anaerophila]|uniref:SatD family (SatD) n=1 Tax=Methylomusa anaerophila TaxID=1930071 RepID=A0A348AHF1_9FIRM|nr:SatD family protein [Methylomusa anaerophila]BBB90499.1 hypothetical protein MAMMFC1_01150 [Methylomusa anaerophila]HML89859.1 SatD family protein [Methylomusa anaerophila]
MIYSAIIGDIADSRKYAERKAIQEQFRHMIDKGNQIFADDIAANFALTLGDEFEVLLSNVSVSLKIVEFARKQMRPYELVVGIGIGEISTDIHPSFVSLADGPAFHRAREAVKQAKKSRSGTLLKADYAGTGLINSLAFFIESCEKKMTDNQFRVVALMEEFNNQKKVAEKLNVTQSTVSKALAAASYYEILMARTEIEKYLKNEFPV